MVIIKCSLLIRRVMVEEYTATEKGALLAWRMAQGERMATRHVTELLGVHRTYSWKLMTRLSRVLPWVRLTNGSWADMDTLADHEWEYIEVLD